jgi:hypothetical protein
MDGQNRLVNGAIFSPPTVTDAWLTSRFAETLVSDIRVPSCYHELWHDRVPWMGFNDRFCEFFYERAA